MTVKEIFDLRRQGRIEEAYEAIRPLYREHKGKFTTLCMFWTASDVFKLRLEQGRVEEAEKIYKAMQRLLPSIEDDSEHKAAGFMHYAEGRLIKASEKFRRRYFAIQRAKGKDANLRDESETCLVSPDQEQTLLEVKDEGINIPSDPSDNPSKEYSEEVADKAGNSSDSSDSCSKDDNEETNSIRDICGICVTSDLSSVQQTVLDAIKSHPGLNVPGISDETGIPAKSVERHVKVLIERHLIEHRGSKKTGGYYLL